MKILLTTPPQSTHSILPNRYKSFHRLLKVIGGNKPILGIQPPYGLMYLSAYLKNSGHNVYLMDGLLASTQDILTKIEKEKVDIVGISSVSWNWSETKKLARLLRDNYPHLKLAVGGAHVNSEKGNVLSDCACFDYAFYGDSEESFCKCVQLLSVGEKPGLMDGFAYRDKDKIIASEKSVVIDNIDGMLFPDRESLGFNNYRPSPLNYRKMPATAIFGSRGCPYSCTFCHTSKRVRMRDAKNLIEEIKLLQKKHGTKEVLFFDDTFTLNKKRVIEFCEIILKNNIDLSWCASARSDTVDAEMLKLMKKAGCWRILVGIESGSQRILNLMKKGTTLSQIENSINVINEAGIQTLGMFIFGFPTETYEEGLETIKFMKKLKLDYISVCNLTPFPGTEVYKEVINEPGFKGFDYMNMFDISYVPMTMKEWQLRDLLRRSLREFYLRPSYILRQLHNIRSFTDFIRYLRGFIIVFLR